jgi:hypothetical protein
MIAYYRWCGTLVSVLGCTTGSPLDIASSSASSSATELRYFASPKLVMTEMLQT